MGKKYNLLGYKSGKLIVIEDVGGYFWNCRCECGEIRKVNTSDIMRKHRRSCGCSRKGKQAWNKGKKMPTGFSEKLSKALKGRVSHRKGKKIGPFSFEHRKKMSEAAKGERSRFWRGGVTKFNLLIRTSFEYRNWRKAVFERDNFTCVWCGDSRGGNLEADHIKPFALYPDFRFSIENGRTLCTFCHKKTDTWGRKTLSLK